MRTAKVHTVGMKIIMKGAAITLHAHAYLANVNRFHFQWLDINHSKYGHHHKEDCSTLKKKTSIDFSSYVQVLPASSLGRVKKLEVEMPLADIEKLLQLLFLDVYSGKSPIEFSTILFC